MNTTLIRDAYGSLHQSHRTTEADCLAYAAARAMVSQAAKSNKIPGSFDNMKWDGGRRLGYARHHEIYDFTASKVLMCARSVEGSRYGQKTTNKDYFLIARQGRGVTVAPASKALAAKAAKSSGEILGSAIEIVLGKSTYKAPANKVRTGYKIVVRNDALGLVSAWDGSAWKIGKTRTEAATEDHRGGFYYYATIEEAVSSAAANDTFGSKVNHRRLVILEVEASGKHFEHGSDIATKLCASRIRPLREVATTI
jgi:hypothetical protein